MDILCKFTDRAELIQWAKENDMARHADDGQGNLRWQVRKLRRGAFNVIGKLRKPDGDGVRVVPGIWVLVRVPRPGHRLVSKLEPFVVWHSRQTDGNGDPVPRPTGDFPTTTFL